MRLTLGQLAQCLQGAGQHRCDPAVEIDDIVTDSRKVTPGCLFVALVGEKFDAHDFLPDVVKAGAAAVVVERLPENLTIPALIVPNTRFALGEMATYWRSQFVIPVIGVTGSNGKTTVKEMIASILVEQFGEVHALATAGNLNNDIGVPQTLFRLDGQHRAAVIELGMNHPGEIAQLTSMAQPTVGLVNNAQREHQEFMQSVEAVAHENGAVIAGLPQDGVAVFPANDDYSHIWRACAGQRKVITFGLEDSPVPVDVVGAFVATEFGNQLKVYLGKEVHHIRLAAAGVHNVLNALAALTTCHAIGCGSAALVRGLQNFKPVSGRLQKKRAHNSAVVIDDTYNANPDSVRAAIHVLAQGSGKKILVLGDMGEVGSNGPAFHMEIGAYARQHGINTLLTLGQLAQHSSMAFGNGARHFEQIETLLSYLDENVTSTSTVLVKGSRFMKMERVVAQLINKENN